MRRPASCSIFDSVAIPRWEDSFHSSYDFGAIILAGGSATTCGHPTYNVSTSLDDDDSVHIRSYPGGNCDDSPLVDPDPDDNYAFTCSDSLYYEGSKKGEINGGTFIHTFDTTGGASGSPIYRSFGGSDRRVVAIHRGGIVNSSPPTNKSSRIRNIDDDDFIPWFNELKNDYDCIPF